ncbi:MAG: cytochrome c oxidase accessory protein CcoG [Burkholderiales bacterium]|nr:cytochrome c oxidase accessory protein CcoG [Burkholderiales bacterium]
MSRGAQSESIKLYARREPIFPMKVRGTFRNLKWGIMVSTLAVYYILPWVRFDRGHDMPNQAVLVDLVSKRFFFFWIEIWPHEFHFIAGLLIMAGIGLFLFTSAFGRVWCGYACPQTVWTDLFITVERWIDGNRPAALNLHHQNISIQKIIKRLSKWSVWLIISILTGGAWVFYFADAPTLMFEIFSWNAPFAAWCAIAILTATTFVFGGFMREQVCTYMCPWPRIQAAMVDEETITIGYREWRGEPRGKKNNTSLDVGDCIDCRVCVNVCPMGIDIRDGQQLPCITCGLCIDGCNAVMSQIGKKPKLIGYMTARDEHLEPDDRHSISIRDRILRPRILLYASIWLLTGLIMLWALFVRLDFDFTVHPIRNPVSLTLSDGSTRNIYEVRFRNMSTENFTIQIGVRGDDSDRLKITTGKNQNDTIYLRKNRTTQSRIYVDAPPNDQRDKTDLSTILIWAKSGDGQRRYESRTTFNRI